MTQFPNTPLVVEQMILHEEISIEQLLAQFKLLVPTNFVQLGEIDYLCSTNPKWTKPLCERYSFTYNNKLLFLDIPHTLLEKLELEKKENIPYPVYLALHVLKKELNLGAITIDNENEIFIQKPLTIKDLEKELIKIKDLSERNSQLETDNSALKNQLSCLENLLKGELQAKISNLSLDLAKLSEWKKELKLGIVPLLFPHSLYTEDTPALDVIIQTVQELIQERDNLLLRPIREEFEEKETELAKLKREKEELIKVKEKLTAERRQYYTDLKTIEAEFETIQEERGELERDKEMYLDGFNDEKEEASKLRSEVFRLKAIIYDLGGDPDDEITEEQEENYSEEENNVSDNDNESLLNEETKSVRTIKN